MESLQPTTRPSLETITADVIKILEETTSDWDFDFEGGIKPDTSLIADLAFESIDIVQFVVALEEHFGRRNLPFEKLLMVEGRYVDDLTVRQVAAFLHEHLSAQEGA